MDDQRLGTAFRQIRIRRGLRQEDVARLAGVSRTTISRMERGHFGTLSVDTVRRVAAALDVRVDLVPRWRAGDLDRLLNARHSQLHESVARRFGELPGWLVRPEVSFAIFGERGVVDILAFHAHRNAVLVIELKTDIADVNELVGTVDRKRRLAAEIASGEGWPINTETRASVWVVVADGATNRRRIAAHRTMLRAAFPRDGRFVAGWLKDPREPMRALSFWSFDHRGNVSAGLAAVRRVRRRRTTRSERIPRSRRGRATGE
jgi:transcriptional regulator with XRE-family HTH domain